MKSPKRGQSHWFSFVVSSSLYFLVSLLFLSLSFNEANRSRFIDNEREEIFETPRTIISARVNCTLMDYIRWTVTFELRSIIRITALLNPPGPGDMKDYTYIRRVAPSSDFNKNVKFYFQIRRHPAQHCRAHRSCFLSLLNSSSFVWDSVVLPSSSSPASSFFPRVSHTLH